MSKDIFVNQLEVDAEVTDFFMAKDIDIRMGSNKKNYLNVTLSDKSGDVNGKKWDVQDDEIPGLQSINAGDIVKIKGIVTEWNNTKQFKILRIRKAAESDDLLMADFIKAAPENPQDMYDYIMSEAEKIGDEKLRAMAVTFLTENKEKLLYFPAAMKNHHAELGGLLWHVKRMLMMGKKACEVYTMMNPDWVVCGVILHDMEKLNEIQSNELGVSPGYTMEGQLLGHIAQGVRAVSELAARVGLDEEKTIMLEHMILSHHYEPEFGSPKRPMFPEAELLHYLDIMDARFFDFEDALSSVDPGSFSENIRTLDGRMVYKPSFAEK